MYCRGSSTLSLLYLLFPFLSANAATLYCTAVIPSVRSEKAPVYGINDDSTIIVHGVLDLGKCVVVVNSTQKNVLLRRVHRNWGGGKKKD